MRGAIYSSKARAPLRAILAMSLIDSLILVSVIWPPILVSIYDLTLYWILILYLPLFFTIPLGIYVMFIKKSTYLNSTFATPLAATSGVLFYMGAEVVELVASLAGTIVRIYYYSKCPSNESNACRTKTNNSAALSLLLLNIIAVGTAAISLLMTYMYLSAVRNSPKKQPLSDVESSKFVVHVPGSGKYRARA